MASDTKTLIRVSNLSKVYKKDKELVHALKKVSLELKAQESAVLVGESGSGKSTLAKIILGLERPSSGAAYCFEEELYKLSAPQARPVYKKVQAVFQNPVKSFNPRHTIAYSFKKHMQNLGYERDKITERSKEVMELCQLDPSFLKRYPHEVSIGQCQRAAIARALSTRPEVLICDEATSALDVSVQAQIVKLLKELKQDCRLSLLFISHDIALVSEIAESIHVMHEGCIVESAKTQDIISHPQDNYTKALISAVL